MQSVQSSIQLSGFPYNCAGLLLITNGISLSLSNFKVAPELHFCGFLLHGLDRIGQTAAITEKSLESSLWMLPL